MERARFGGCEKRDCLLLTRYVYVFRRSGHEASVLSSLPLPGAIEMQMPLHKAMQPCASEGGTDPATIGGIPVPPPWCAPLSLGLKHLCAPSPYRGFTRKGRPEYLKRYETRSVEGLIEALRWKLGQDALHLTLVDVALVTGSLPTVPGYGRKTLALLWECPRRVTRPLGDVWRAPSSVEMSHCMASVVGYKNHEMALRVRSPLALKIVQRRALVGVDHSDKIVARTHYS